MDKVEYSQILGRLHQPYSYHELRVEGWFVDESEPEDAWVLDWSVWAGTYEVWQRRRTQYQAAILKLQTQTPILADIIGRTARRESIPVPV